MVQNQNHYEKFLKCILKRGRALYQKLATNMTSNVLLAKDKFFLVQYS